MIGIPAFVGSLIWCLALAYFGEQLGKQWNENPALKSAFQGADLLLVALGIIAVVGFIWSRRRRS